MLSIIGRTSLQTSKSGRTVRAMDRAFERGAPHAPCTRQLQRGLNRLRFDDLELEQEFRRRYTDLNIGRIRAGVILGLLLVLLVAFLDLVTAPAEIRLSAFGEKMALLLPVPLLTLWVAHHPRYYHHVDRAMFAAIVAVGCIFAAIQVQMGVEGYVQPHYSLMLVIFFAYFLSALLWPACVVAGWAVTAAVIGGDIYLGLPVKEQAYGGLHLFAANLVGMVGSYMLERVSRREYLHAGSASEMADIDRVTSLRSADSFARRLRRWWNKAVIRRNSIGLMLIDIDYFRRFDESCGHYAAEQALRIIAQSIQGLRSTQECFLARLDDDGFGVIMRDATPEALEALAKEIHQTVDGLNLQHPDSPIADRLTVTIVGRVTAPEDSAEPEDFSEAVREDLDRVKRCDRNTIWIDADIGQCPTDPGTNVTPLRQAGG